jgi:hypothetical protein
MGSLSNFSVPTSFIQTNIHVYTRTACGPTQGTCPAAVPSLALAHLPEPEQLTAAHCQRLCQLLMDCIIGQEDKGNEVASAK